MTETFDIVIAGGGITGAGIARDAALRGLKVALFEKGDFGSGTSSKSSKLVHGGLRYLEHGEVGLVFESVSERRVQRNVAPHIVRPMPFLMPIYEDTKVGLELMNVGMWIYNTLALFRSPKLHKTYRGRKAAEVEPQLRTEGLKGGIVYYDCFTDDSRLVLENILDARAIGAVCENHTEVIGLQRSSGRVSAVRVRDLLTGEEKSVATRTLIIAAGPWSDRVIDCVKADIKTPLLRPTKGVHLVFPGERVPVNRAVTVVSPIDGRVMFVIPWRKRIIVGTTDTDFNGDPDQVHASAADARYLCEAANHFLPAIDLKPEDAISTWAGLRPLIHEEADSASDVSREHQIYVQDDGIVLIAGGKLTTYRLMAKQTVRAAIRWLDDNDCLPDSLHLVRPRTKKRALPGAVGLADRSVAGIADFANQLAAEHGASELLCDHLCSIYGTRSKSVLELIEADPSLGEPMQSDLPYVWAEVAYALEHEAVRTVDDILSRRVPLLLVGRDQGLDVVDQVADRAQAKFGWSDAIKQREIERYRTTVNNSRRFRSA